VPPHRELGKLNGGHIPCVDVIMEAARLSTEEGQLREGLRYYCAVLRLTSYWAAQSSYYQRQHCCWIQYKAFHGIIEWSNHPRQTPDLLRSAIRSMQVELDLFPSWRETFVAQHLSELKVLDEQIEFTRRNPDPRAHLLNMHNLVLAYSRYLPWERQRFRQLRERQLVAFDDGLQFFLDYAAAPDAERRLQLSDHVSYRRSEADEARIDSSTPLFYIAPQLGRQSHLYNGIRYFQQKQIEHDVEKRVAVLALLLRIHKLEHNSWPKALADFFNAEAATVSVPSLIMIDPWNGESFQYFGHRFDPTTPRQLLLSSVHAAQIRDVPGVTYQKNHRGHYWRTGQSFKPGLDQVVELWVDSGNLVIKPARISDGFN